MMEADKYEELVEEGVLTDDEVDDIIEYMEDIREEMMEAREELEEELEDMTDEERKEYLQSIDRDEMTNPIDAMVEDGIIDEDQAGAIKEVIGSGSDNGQKGGMNGGQRGGMQGKGGMNGGSNGGGRGNDDLQSSSDSETGM